uniref:Uncharacterized protein n=1 Tax=Plectus sambesii TaxID=2011161 RepID=A0A914VLU2_9BILA
MAPMTEATSSATHCPLSVVEEVCPSESFMWYYECCGALKKTCCFRFETWTLFALGVIILLAAISVLLCIVRFICSCCRRSNYPERRR